MSAEKIVKEISQELERVNEEIDIRIIKGMPYKREAKRHKLLLSMLNGFSQKTSTRHSFSFMSLLF